VSPEARETPAILTIREENNDGQQRGRRREQQHEFHRAAKQWDATRPDVAKDQQQIFDPERPPQLV